MTATPLMAPSKLLKTQSFCKLIIEPRRGYGIALRTGMKHAKGNIIVMVDGDGTYELSTSTASLNRMIQKDADMVLATRMYDPNKAMGFRTSSETKSSLSV